MPLTEQELKSKSDEELNLLAAHAMGYPVLERSIDIHRQISEVGFPYFRNDPLTGPWLYSDSARLDGALIWKPTTDADQAIELAEMIRSKTKGGFYTWSSPYKDKPGKAEFYTSLFPDGGTGDASFVEEFSFSKALTIAALLAHHALSGEDDDE